MQKHAKHLGVNGVISKQHSEMESVDYHHWP